LRSAAAVSIMARKRKSNDNVGDVTQTKSLVSQFVIQEAFTLDSVQRTALHLPETTVGG